MLGVPVLAGGAAYDIAGARVWRGTLKDRPRLAKKFYAVVAVSMLLGSLLTNHQEERLMIRYVALTGPVRLLGGNAFQL
jgi:hypothetical protein